MSGKDVPALLQYLGLGETINLAKNAVPATRRVNSKPLTGDITLWASDVGAISADAVGEITDNGTMASANTPGWWRVEVSNSDTVADFPTYPDGSKLYSYGYLFVEKIGEVWFQHYYAHMGANAKRQDWGTVPNTSRPWIVDYNTANKPTANDVQALPIAGGRLNGPLSIGTDNALGGNSIVLGDNDTGFKQNGDGLLDIYANGVQVFRFQNDTLESKKSINVTGRLTPTDYGNFDSRFVQDIRLGSLQYGQVWNGPGFSDTSGYVITGIINGNSDELVDGAHRRPIQKLIGNQWYNVVSI
ncbi:phage tail protein [Salmonella enterica]|nr:phage tail protein [Salmonella enterica]EBR8135282.1 phage tail protein [Salmonella enterica subsp. enterica serovar Oranienburg]EHG0012433.1 phage tail protein [Salmonella enterica subsp. enterica serovar Magwa]HCM6289331.1 phage tail protein [Salmonella enterica subsp. enterica serovar 16:l,v:-]EAV2592615.1 phage tail protein [Salmonella enterica]